MDRPAKFPPEFPKEAVELVASSGRPIAEVARSLGVPNSTLSNWVRADRDAKARADDPEALTESLRTGRGVPPANGRVPAPRRLGDWRAATAVANMRRAAMAIRQAGLRAIGKPTGMPLHRRWLWSADRADEWAYSRLADEVDELWIQTQSYAPDGT